MYDFIQTAITRSIEEEIELGMDLERVFANKSAYQRVSLPDLVAVLQHRRLEGESSYDREKIAKEFLLLMKTSRR